MSNPKSNLPGNGPGDARPSSNRTPAKARGGSFKRTPRDFLDMFLERWWIGAVAGGLAAGLIVFFRPHFEPLYRSEVTLLFESKGTHSAPGMYQVVDPTLRDAMELNTHMEQMRSNTFADYVLQSFTPDEKAVIQKPYLDPLKPESPPPSLAEIIRPNVYVAARRSTPIVAITITNRSPQAAALIAQRYAQKYIEYKLDSAQTQTTTVIMFLQQQKEELRTQVEQIEKKLREFRQEHNLAAFPETQNLVLQQHASLGNQQVKAKNDMIEAKFVVDKIDDYVRAKRNLLEIPQIVSFGRVSELSNTLNTLQTQRNLLDERYGAEHPRIKQNELDTRETQRMLRENLDNAIADMRARYERATQYLQRLDEEMVSVDKQVRELDSISTDYKILERDDEEKSKAYANITSSLTQAKITQQQSNQSIAIFDPAYIPGAPSDTGLAAISMKASVAGFGLLLIIPLGLGLFDTRIRTPNHVEEALQEPLLGAVKKMRKMGETQRAQVFRLQKDRDLAEAYLGIFSEVEMRSSLGFPKTLLITSSVPAEGKSLLSSNLAAVFASHKRRTLLVDCDLRRPTLHRYFGVKVETGWVQWLETPSEQRPAAPVGIVAITDDLHLLPAGKSPHNPTELLDRLSRRETLQPLLQNYDMVIFDTPPAAVFPDALMLARSCHEMIYVCRYRSVRLAVVRKVLDRFADSGISCLGIVLNHLPETKARSYGYHGYGTQSAAYYKAYSEKPDGG